MVDMVIVALNQGLLWAIMAIGIYVSYRILDFPDLTAEGAFTMGASVSANMLLKDINPFLAIAIATVIGGLAGLVTGLLHTKLKIPPLLAGILTMTGLYSINLRIMGKANLTFINSNTVIKQIESYGVSTNAAAIIVGLACSILVVFVLWWFFNTELGYAVRATGDNENMIKALGVNSDNMKILGLIIGNALVALSGALVSQEQSYSDIGFGVGSIVIGLASVIIGEVLFSKKNSYKIFVAVIFGSIAYRLIVAVVLAFNLNPNDLKLFSASLLALILASPLIKEKLNIKKRKGGAA